MRPRHSGVTVPPISGGQSMKVTWSYPPTQHLQMLWGKEKYGGRGAGPGGGTRVITDHRPLTQCSCCSLGAAPHSTPTWRHHLFYSPFSHATQTQPQILINHPPLVPKPSPSPSSQKNSISHLTVTRILRTSVLHFPLGHLEPH